MLTRLPGDNGSGKILLARALYLVRQFVIRGDRASASDILRQRTRWLIQHEQICELEVELDGATYIYSLTIEPCGDPPMPRVASETLV